MKYNNSYGALMILALVLVIGAPMIHAQARAKANVSFDFNMDQTSMPAGNYEISSLNENVLSLRNLKSGETRLVIVPVHVQAPVAAGIPKGKLVFHKYDDQYFLAQIWDGQNETGFALAESKREKELMLSSNAPQPETVVIAMK
jgi:hypothetical protein